MFDHDPEIPAGFQDADIEHAELEARAREPRAFCARCGQSITRAVDGAWEDDRGACGCGDAEHEPEA